MQLCCRRVPRSLVGVGNQAKSAYASDPLSLKRDFAGVASPRFRSSECHTALRPTRIIVFFGTGSRSTTKLGGEDVV